VYLSIADGKKTAEEIREATRERTERNRENANPLRPTRRRPRRRIRQIGNAASKTARPHVCV
jgi:hypothetical protein